MTTHINLQGLDRLTINSFAYRPVETNNDGHLVERIDQPGLIEAFSHEQLAKLWGTNALRHEPQYFSKTKSLLRMSASVTTLAELNEQDRLLALWRQAYCDFFLKAHAKNKKKYKRTNATAEAAAEEFKPLVDAMGIRALKTDPTAKKRKARAGSTKPTEAKVFPEAPSGRTLLQWIRIYEAGGCHAVALRPHYNQCGNRFSRFLGEEQAILTREVAKYATSEKPPIERIVENVEMEIDKANVERIQAGLPVLKQPGKKAIKLAIDRLDPFYVLVMREGREYAEKHMAWVGQGLIIDHPGHRIEIDEHEIDLMSLTVWSGVWELLSEGQRQAVARERVWVAMAIDAASRVILGMRIVPHPTVSSGLALLKMIMMDKGSFASAVDAQTPWDMHCGLTTIVADWGYGSAEIRAAVADAGGTLEFPPAGAASARAKIERVFRTVGTKLIPRLRGRTWSNVVERAGYPSEDTAGLTTDEIAFAMTRWVVDIYHNTEHDGLHGETPRNAWLRLSKLYHVKAPMDACGMRSAFGVSLSKKITNRGFEVLGNFYRPTEEHEHQFLHSRQRKFEVRFDTDNIGAISVRIGEQFIQVPCLDKKMEGVSAADWIATGTALRRKHARAARLVRPIVHAALNAIIDLNGGAARRANLATPLYSAVDVERAEKAIFFELELVDEVHGERSDLLGERIAPIDLADISTAFQSTEPSTHDPKSPLRLRPSAPWKMEN